MRHSDLFWYRKMPRRSRPVRVAATVLLALALIVFGSWLAVRNYRECRAHGFSVLYCFTTRR